MNDKARKKELEEAKSEKKSKELAGLVPLTDVVQQVVNDMLHSEMPSSMHKFLYMLEDGLKEQTRIDGVLGYGALNISNRAVTASSIKVDSSVIDLPVDRDKMADLLRAILNERDEAMVSAKKWESEWRVLEAKVAEERHDKQKAAWEDRVAADDAKRESKKVEKEAPSPEKSCFIVSPNIFPFDVMFSFNQTREEVSEWFAERGYESFDDFDETDLADIGKVFDKETVFARTYGHERGPIIIRFKEWEPSVKGFGFLAHEIFHAVEFMMVKMNIPHGVWTTSEVYAYTTQFLFEQAMENLGLTYQPNGN
jgi:hypothetical protein